jgi:hypothetical protein
MLYAPGLLGSLYGYGLAPSIPALALILVPENPMSPPDIIKGTTLVTVGLR